MDGTQFLTVQQAAAHFQVTEKTIRRRIADGKLNAEKVPTSQGYEWRITVELGTTVQVDISTVQVDSANVQVPQQEDVQTEGPPVHVESAHDAALIRAIELADRLQQENALLVNQNVQLAGQVGFYQARVQALESQVKLLTDSQHTPKQPAQPEAAPEPTPQPAEPTKRVPWWKRLWRGE